MHGARLLTALLITVAALGCSPVSERDLVGTWKLTDESRQQLPEKFRAATGTLTLAADGTFTASELPVSIQDWATAGDSSAPKERPTILTGTGDWALRRAPEGNDAVILSIETVSEDFTGDPSYGYALSVRPALRGNSLVDYWGDPDTAPGVFFSKTEAP